ncbi:MAG: cytochrome c biogenesis protein CcdA [Bacteroidota bacterium]
MLKASRFLFTTAVLLFLYINSIAQMVQPDKKWDYSVEKKGKETILVIKATMNPGWHLYSQFTPAGGPMSTSFSFTPSKDYKLIGKAEESAIKTYYDSTFEVNVQVFEHDPVFRQKIEVLSEKKFTIKGTVDGQACNDQTCVLINTVNLKFVINADAKEAAAIIAEDTITETVIETPVDTTTKQQVVETVVATGDCGDWSSGEFIADKSFWGIFIAGFIGGLLALLTPCVFPMIPMTVSFFTKRSGSRKKGLQNAIIYALSIIIIYVTLGFLVTVTLGSDALNDLSTNGYFNMAFFIIFIVFAFSFFGAFEIVLPSSLVNKADQASDKGGLIGIFFMAFTLSLVSFSCTGPIIGTLLVEAAHGRSYLGPVAGMSGFAIALALPFALFAAFPGWLNTIPKSGGWLNAVKVCLGFIELALALKFLSNVDLAYHWDFLHREIFIAFWVIIFGLMGVYLLGKIKFSHDSDVPHVTVPRLLFAVLTFSFVIYILPGMWGAPVKVLSGILPPEYYKEWKTKGSGECPHDLLCFHDYKEGMDYAKAQGKPVIIDFTGYNCANCRKMEDNVWSDPKVLKLLSDDYVLISLYVDDKKELPPAEQYTSAFSGKKIKTLGNKWSDMQAQYYDSNSQPMYALIDHKEKKLAKPWSGFDPDIDKYKKFLEEGICRFRK